MTGQGRLKADWNRALLSEIITDCYIILLENLAQEISKKWPDEHIEKVISEFYSIFPTNYKSAPFQLFLETFFYRISDKKILFSENEPHWLEPQRTLAIVSNDKESLTKTRLKMILTRAHVRCEIFFFFLNP